MSGTAAPYTFNSLTLGSNVQLTLNGALNLTTFLDTSASTGTTSLTFTYVQPALARYVAVCGLLTALHFAPICRRISLRVCMQFEPGFFCE